MKKWVTLQLTERGESVLEGDPTSILKVVKKFIKSECFIPVYYNKSKSYENRIFLFKGYIFAVYNKEEINNYFKLVGTQYFIGPLMSGRVFHLTDNDEIKKLKQKLLKLTKPNIKVGDKVIVQDGKYKHMTALVSDYYPRDKEADLTIELKCMNIIVPRIPVVCLQKISEIEKKEINLNKKIIEILTSSRKGLSRKQILEFLDLSEGERKRLSTVLSRYVKKGVIKTKKSDGGKFVFI